jgi:hypothetical protein
LSALEIDDFGLRVWDIRDCDIPAAFSLPTV